MNRLVHLKAVAITIAAAAALFGIACAGSGDPDSRRAELKDSAKSLLSDVVIEMEVRRDSAGSVMWEVGCDDPADAKASPEAQAQGARRIARARALNAALVEIAKAHSPRDFDAETMVATQVEFREGSERAYTVVARLDFRGSRLWYAYGAGELKSDPEATVPGLRAELEVVPDKLVWSEGEPIAGIVRILNIGDRPIVIPWEYMPTVSVVDGAGAEPPTFSSGGFCGGTGGMREPEPLVLAPGGSIRRSFGFETDPLGSFGVLLDPGRYRLECAGFGNRLNIASRVVPAPIEVRLGGARPLGARIVNLAASARTVSVTRADGRFEVHDVDTGRLVAAARPEGYSRSGQDYDQWRWSPDGSIAARISQSNSSDKPTSVVVLRPGGSPPLQSFAIPVKDVWYMGARVTGISQDSSRVYIGVSDLKCMTLTLADGAWREEQQGFHSSPDGKFLLSESLEAMPRGGGPTITPPFQANPYDGPFEGVLGWYHASNQRAGNASGDPAGADREGEVVFASYDGAVPRTIVTTATRVRCESPSGRYVAVSSEQWGFEYGGDAGRLEVWDVEQGRKVLTINDGRSREAAFAGDGLLVCAPRVRKNGRTSICSLDEVCEVYDLPAGNLLRTIRLEESEPETATRPPDGPT